MTKATGDPARRFTVAIEMYYVIWSWFHPYRQSCWYHNRCSCSSWEVPSSAGGRPNLGAQPCSHRICGCNLRQEFSSCRDFPRLGAPPSAFCLWQDGLSCCGELRDHRCGDLRVDLFRFNSYGVRVVLADFSFRPLVMISVGGPGCRIPLWWTHHLLVPV